MLMQADRPQWTFPESASRPLLSVVMPVRNAMPYLDQAVQSILDQTYRNFEFVVVDDGSTDGSWERLQHLAESDDRIRLFRNPHPAGPVSSSNHAVAMSSGELVARMDADDVAHPQRLERQLRAIAQDGDVVLVGTLWNAIDSSGRTIRSRDRSQMNSRKLRAPFCHGSIIFRRAAFEAAGGYRAPCEFWEDTDLYFRLANFGRIMILPDELYSYRFSRSSTRLTSDAVKVEKAVDLYFRCADALASGQEYEDILGATGSDTPGRLSLRVFGALAAMRVWSGRRPLLLRQALSRGRLPASFAELASLIFICAGNIHPGPIRALLRRRTGNRDRSHSALFRDGQPSEWHWSRRHSATRSTKSEVAGGDLSSVGPARV